VLNRAGGQKSRSQTARALSLARKYPGYRRAFEETRLVAGDELESIAVERATVGWLEPVHYQGKVCGHITRYSDGLLMFLLRGMMPEKYGVQRRQQVSAPPPVQPNIQLTFVYPDGRERMGA
jgi:hypothetical protein